MINAILVDDILQTILLQTKNCNICYVCNKWYTLCHQKIINCLCNVYKHINPNEQQIHCLYYVYKYFNSNELTIPDCDRMIGSIKYDDNDFIWQTPSFQIRERLFNPEKINIFYGDIIRLSFDFPLNDQIGCHELKQFFGKIDKKMEILWSDQNKQIDFAYKPIINETLNKSSFWIAALEWNFLSRQIITPILMRDPDMKKNPIIIVPKNLRHLDELIPPGSTIRLIIHTKQINLTDYNKNNRLKFKIKMIECTPRKKNTSSEISFF